MKQGRRKREGRKINSSIQKRFVCKLFQLMYCIVVKGSENRKISPSLEIGFVII